MNARRVGAGRSGSGAKDESPSEETWPEEEAPTEKPAPTPAPTLAKGRGGDSVKAAKEHAARISLKRWLAGRQNQGLYFSFATEARRTGADTKKHIRKEWDALMEKFAKQERK